MALVFFSSGRREVPSDARAKQKNVSFQERWNMTTSPSASSEQSSTTQTSTVDSVATSTTTLPRPESRIYDSTEDLDSLHEDELDEEDDEDELEEEDDEEEENVEESDSELMFTEEKADGPTLLATCRYYSLGVNSLCFECCYAIASGDSMQLDNQLLPQMPQTSSLGSKLERLAVECRQAEFQLPCQRGQKWYCQYEFDRWRKHKCKLQIPIPHGRKAYKKCACFTPEGLVYRKIPVSTYLLVQKRDSR